MVVLVLASVNYFWLMGVEEMGVGKMRVGEMALTILHNDLKSILL